MTREPVLWHPEVRLKHDSHRMGKALPAEENKRLTLPSLRLMREKAQAYETDRDNVVWARHRDRRCAASPSNHGM